MILLKKKWRKLCEWMMVEFLEEQKRLMISSLSGPFMTTKLTTFSQRPCVACCEWRLVSPPLSLLLFSCLFNCQVFFNRRVCLRLVNYVRLFFLFDTWLQQSFQVPWFASLTLDPWPPVFLFQSLNKSNQRKSFTSLSLCSGKGVFSWLFDPTPSRSDTPHHHHPFTPTPRVVFLFFFSQLRNWYADKVVISLSLSLWVHVSWREVKNSKNNAEKKTTRIQNQSETVMKSTLIDTNNGITWNNCICETNIHCS